MLEKIQTAWANREPMDRFLANNLFIGFILLLLSIVFNSLVFVLGAGMVVFASGMLADYDRYRRRQDEIDALQEKLDRALQEPPTDGGTY